MKFCAMVLATATLAVGCVTGDIETPTPELQLKAMSQESQVGFYNLKTIIQQYLTVDRAIAEGYQLGYHGAAAGCVQNPGVGAMGYHYFSWPKMDDPTINPFDPEVLVYQTQPDGTLTLGAVEWVVPKAAWEAAGNTAPPVVWGQTMHIINPVLNWYVEHAWILEYNPSGFFADWNPNVTCP